MQVLGGDFGTGRLRIKTGHPPTLQIGRGHSVPLVQMAGFAIVDRRTVPAVASLNIDRRVLVAEVAFRNGHRLHVAGRPGQLSALRDAAFRAMDADLNVPAGPKPLIARTWSMAVAFAAWLLAGNWFSETG